MPIVFLWSKVSSGGRKWLCLHGCRAARWRHALGALQEAAHLLCTIARGRLVLPQTLLKGLEGLRAGLADLTDDGVGGRALSDAHLEVVTVALPRLRLGRNTLAILVQLSAAVAGSDLQGRLHVEAGAWEQQSGRYAPPFPVSGCYGGSQPNPLGFSFSGNTAYKRLYSLKGQTVMAAPCLSFRLSQ